MELSSNKPYVTIIISLYKDLTAMKVVLKALQNQTNKNFEVIIAEDDNNIETPELLLEFSDLQIKHVSHPDTGNYKVVVLNQAVSISSGEYLIFIDGDCVVFSDFIDGHISLAQKKKVLCGRRVNLGPYLTKMIKEEKVNPLEIERKPWKYLITMIRDDMDHLEELITLKPHGIVFRIVKFFRKKKKVALLGCCFSLYKVDFEKINGFDEGYDTGPIAHDTDLDWRFRASGLELVSCKNIASMFHLYHGKRRSSKGPKTPHRIRMEKMQEINKYVCEDGLNLH